jgi:hypothetical protein
MSKAFNTNFIKCVFVAVIFGFLFQLREIAGAEYQCPSFGALLFFCRPRLMCQQRSRDVPHQREDGFDWFSMNLSAGTA